jgi:hypothetical protein
MDVILGLFGIAVWIVSVIALAAAVTFLVIKLTPGDKDEKPKPAEAG